MKNSFSNKKRNLNIETENNFSDEIVNKEKEETKNYESDILVSIREYMESELKVREDNSYQWIEKDLNIKYLNKCIEADLINIKNVINKRDMECELKLLKLMTEDKKHKEKLIVLPKECKKLNRYNDILPYRHNTVFLNKSLSSSSKENDYNFNSETENITNLNENLDNTENEDILNNYINGSYISGPLKEDTNLFIATQGPLNTTFENFWKLILYKNIKLIIMLSNLQEEGRRKCDQYWPKDVESPLIYSNLQISMESEEQVLDKSVIQRIFTVYNLDTDIKSTVTQLQMICWPDHSVPEEKLGYMSIELLLSYIFDFRNCYKDSPVIAHCSAGIGRTGTFIAIYNLCKALSLVSDNNKSYQNKTLPFFSVFNAVRKLKEQRLGMVTDSTQYKYIYIFISEWLKRNFEL